jgi:predicted phage terminase large subunit-like protein
MDNWRLKWNNGAMYLVLALPIAESVAAHPNLLKLRFWQYVQTLAHKKKLLLNMLFKPRKFPELKAKALEMYNEWEPDACIIEAKAAGSPLIYELRRMGILVSEFTPTRGNDKIARMNSVTDLFSSGKVWAPSRRWADEVMEEMAAFPNSEHDDLVDSSTQALIRFRKGGFVSLPSDEPEDKITFRRKAAYY